MNKDSRITITLSQLKRLVKEATVPRKIFLRDKINEYLAQAGFGSEDDLFAFLDNATNDLFSSLEEINRDKNLRYKSADVEVLVDFSGKHPRAAIRVLYITQESDGFCKDAFSKFINLQRETIRKVNMAGFQVCCEFKDKYGSDEPIRKKFIAKYNAPLKIVELYNERL